VDLSAKLSPVGSEISNALSNYRTRAKSTTATSAEKGRGTPTKKRIVPTSGVTAVTKEDAPGKIAPNITLATTPRKNPQQPANGCDKVEFPNSQNLLFNRVFYQLSLYQNHSFAKSESTIKTHHGNKRSVTPYRKS
jgi:hypothetical protein